MNDAVRMIHRRMSWQQFLDYPRKVGWKHEYYGGKIHVTPAHLSIGLELRLDRAVRPGTACLRPLQAADAAVLLEPFASSFSGTMDYVEYSPRERRKQEEDFIASFFANKEGVWLPASTLALTRPNGTILGGALVRRGRCGPLLAAVFVRSRWRRQGAATSLIANVVALLRATGERRLFSRCVLGNEPSLAWHLRVGFRERPDRLVAAHRARIYADEGERLTRLKGPDAPECARYMALANRWRARYRGLEAQFRRDPEAAGERTFVP